jgi:hypothetical protein
MEERVSRQQYVCIDLHRRCFCVAVTAHFARCRTRVAVSLWMTSRCNCNTFCRS